MHCRIPLLFLLCTLHFSIAQTIDATLVELNLFEDSDPQNFTAFQNGFYFTATDGYNENYGRELWYSDGTASGTQLVKDIKQGRNSSDPSAMVISNNTLFFTADDGIHGAELWKSDGTENGTVMVKDIRLNNDSSYSGPYSLIDFNGTLFFNARNSADGRELWKSDGTEDGTIMVKDINKNGDGNPSDLFVFNNSIYFTANDGSNGIELWKSDGTESGTVMIKNINPNYSGINPGNTFLTLNDFFYFFATNESNGFELWKSDGTEVGTTMVKDIHSGMSSSSFSLRGGSLNTIIIFEANDGINGTELWKSDGTENGTSLIKNINGTALNSISSNSPFITFNNELYFLADDSIHGTEIWKSDGTAAGTTLLKDINDGDSSIWIEKFHKDHINHKLLFFTSSTDSSDKTLWVSDGSSIGTFELSNIKDSNLSSLEEDFITLNSSTIVTGENDTNGNELWETDGTISGTSLFIDLNHSASSSPSKFTNVGSKVFFRAAGKESGTQLFSSDGSTTGTLMAKDIFPGYNCIDDHSDMKSIDGVLFFSAIDGVHGYEPWRSDGTENGTFMLKDIGVGNQSSMQNNNSEQKFSVLNDILYFSADDGINGNELWTSDGTQRGTYMIKNINTSSNFGSGSHPREFVLMNDVVYFIGNDESGTGLWTTDRTGSGTKKIINLNDMRVLKAVNDKLIIVAETSGTTYGPHDVWVSDGTQFGTSHIQTFGDGIDSNIQFSTELNDELYFVAKSPTSFRKAVYKTDGTVAGTRILFDGADHPTMPDLDIDIIMTCGNYVYFPVQDSSDAGKELWRTDGTTTEQIAGSDTADFLYIRDLTCYQNNLLYLAESFPHNIWITGEHINAPVKLDVNILNGPNFENYNAIEDIGVSDNNVYFNARNDVSGSELYITDINPSSLSLESYERARNDYLKLVRLYPNPTDDFIKIESATNSNIEKFEIWDVSGKRIYMESNKNATRISFSTKKISVGIYFVKVFLKDARTETLKLVVNH